MTNKNISGLAAATVPVAGTELLAVWDTATANTKYVTIANLVSNSVFAGKFTTLDATGNITAGALYSQGGVVATTYGDANSHWAVVKNTSNAGSMNLRWGTADVKVIQFANDSAGDGHSAGIGTTTDHDFHVLRNGGVVGTFSSTGLDLAATTDATSTTAAALKTAGGLAVAKKAYFGDAIIEQRCKAVWQYTNWSPSDVAGAETAPTTTAASTRTAASYITSIAMSGDTLTITFAKDGDYTVRLDLSSVQDAVTPTQVYFRHIIGGSATRYWTPTGMYNLLERYASAYSTRSVNINVTATAGQTLTVRLWYAVTSAGTASNYVASAAISAIYEGT